MAVDDARGQLTPQVQAPVNVVHTRTLVDPRYGTKSTGKAGKTTLGVLFANDEGASLGVDDLADPAFGQSAQTFVGRVRYDRGQRPPGLAAASPGIEAGSPAVR